jgi:adenylate cyclase
MFRNSPFEALLEGSGGFRQRVEGSGTNFEFPLLAELHDEGATDYVIMPLKFTNGSINYISWATDQDGGFTTGDLALLYDLLPLISPRHEIDNVYRVSWALLGVYLGKVAAHRVFKGKVRCGGERIVAAILYADLRNFTSVVDRRQAQYVLDLLNGYFERIVGAVETNSGEILKFMGDAALAIFPFTEGDEEAACCRALDAAIAGLKALDRFNAERGGEGLGPVRLGIAPHLREVTFGNIGAPGRLDFTVIGRAVNGVSRLDALCASLDRPLLTSAGFAESCGAIFSSRWAPTFCAG